MKQKFGHFIPVIMIFLGGIISSHGKNVDLTSLSIEELMNIEINLASRKAEKIMDVAAAAYVLTHEEIINSGFTSVPEVLRLVPGMEVGRFDANKWAITARGYNNLYANKLLVLIDGRSVYNPLFSGVFWELQHIPLQDIERIEVIRGPGGTLWGANAVNGIINIITRKSQDTQGGYVKIRSGAQERVAGTVRWGARINPSLTYRAYIKAFGYGQSELPAGGEAADDWTMNRAGFRVDWHRDSRTSWSAHGDLYSGRIGQTLRVATPQLVLTKDYQTQVRGGYGAGEYRKVNDREYEFVVRYYFDVFRRQDKDLIGGGYTTFNLDFQYHIPFQKHRLVSGAGYRVTHDSYDNSDFLQFIPSSRTYHLVSFFVHDEYKIWQDKIHFLSGIKFEQDDYTGFHVQPNLRLLWKTNPRTRVWGAVSRAIRAPARTDKDMVNVLYHGNPNYKAEELLSYEFGLRRQITQNSLMELTSYYHDYDHLNSVEPEMSDNKKQGQIYGIEFSADWMILSRLKIRSAFSTMQIHLQLDPDSRDSRGSDIEKESPAHQAMFNVTWELSKSMILNANVKYVSSLRAPQVQADAYTGLNISLHHQVWSWLRITVAGQNLLQDIHEEFPAEWAPFEATSIQRSWYGQLLISF